MMEVFWICEQCDSTNDYFTAKVCSVCGWKIDQKSEEKCIYEVAEQLYAKAATSTDLFAVSAHYRKILTYKDARQKHNDCLFKAQKALLNEKAYLEGQQHLKTAAAYCAEKKWTYAIRTFSTAEQAFQKAAGYSNARQLAQDCRREAELCRCKDIYFQAKEILVSAKTIADYKQAAELFNQIKDFSDAKENHDLCLKFISELTIKQDLKFSEEGYQDALRIQSHETRLKTLEQLFQDYKPYLQTSEFAGFFANCNRQINETKKHVDYDRAVGIMNNAATADDCKRAAAIFALLSGFRDSAEKKEACNEKADLLTKRATYHQALDAYERGRKITIFNWRKYL